MSWFFVLLAMGSAIDAQLQPNPKRGAVSLCACAIAVGALVALEALK